MVKSHTATATKLTLPVVHASVNQKPAVSHRSSNFDGKKHLCTRFHATQRQKLSQRHPNRIELVAEINGNCARQPSQIALLPANFWTANSEGTQLVAHLTVISGSRLALEVCRPGKVRQRPEDAPSYSICQPTLLTPKDMLETCEDQPPRQRFSST